MDFEDYTTPLQQEQQQPRTPIRAVGSAPQPNPTRIQQPPISPNIAATDLDSSIFARQDAAIASADAAIKIAEKSRSILEDKIKAFKAVCAKLDDAAKEFTSAHTQQFMKEMKDTCISLWSNALSGSPYQDSTTYASKLAAGLKQPAQQQTQRPRRARETDGSNRPLPQPQQPATRQTEDIRIYIRLDECSPAWTKSPMTIRLMIAQALDLPAKTVPQAWLVKTGWAVRPADLITHAKILEAEHRLTALLGAEKIEISQKWHTYVVKGCPRTIQDHLGQPIELEALIKDEAKIQTGYEPTSWRLSQHTQPEDHLITVLISFLRPLRT
ncbi:hypothetical protein EDB80DRAFT_654858 [Ilyonectria destructans]|nr:hypothetical protein EDB80DRAFT_654858 [Ilyonectria destructans]